MSKCLDRTVAGSERKRFRPDYSHRVDSIPAGCISTVKLSQLRWRNEPNAHKFNDNIPALVLFLESSRMSPSVFAFPLEGMESRPNFVFVCKRE
jgi:hypothetical protein